MKLRVAGALALALFAAGCQKNAAPSDHLDEAKAPSPTKPQEPATSGPPAPSIAAALLAYAYRYDIKAPSARVPEILNRHEQACAAAGPATCQVLAEHAEALGRANAHGELVLRATPTWLDRFRAGLAGDAGQIGGAVVGSGIETEDLTRPLVDQQAAVRGKRAVRDELQADAKRGAASEQLAQAQNELDAAHAELASSQARVEMAKLTITYRALGSLGPDSAFAPVGAATDEAFRLAMRSLAVLITIASYAAPFAFAIAVGAWALRRRRPNREAIADPAPPKG